MLKTLFKSVREYKRLSIITPILVFIEVIIECIIPLVIAELVNRLQAEEGMEIADILKYGGVVVILAILSLTFGALAGLTCSTASCGFARNLRRDMFVATQGFSFENIDRISTSSLVTRLTTDVTNVQQSYMMIIRTAVRAPFMFIFAITMAFVMGGNMAWIFVVVVPILLFVLIAIIRSVMPLFRKVFRKYDKLNASVQENVKGMRVVKSFVREEHEQKKFGAASDDVCRDFTHAERILVLQNPTMQLCLNIVMVFVLSFGSYTIVSSGGKALGVGHLSALLTYGFMILSSLMMLSMIFVMLTLSLESGRRIAEVIEEKSTLSNPENPLYTVADGSIDFDNVFFKYSKDAERYVLSDVNLHIHSGETIGIISGTGASKTTLVQLISRLYDATEGTVRVGGVDVRDYDIETLRNSVAVVLQKNLLFSGTIAENLRWGDADATDDELREACRLAAADEFVEGFPDKYETYVEQGGANLSGGQRQRLCIARALLKKPKILILDDSTSAVDTRTDARIREAMSKYIPETTKIIIAQRVSSVESADRILVLDSGKISALGTHEQLLATSEIYRDIYTSQTRAVREEAK